MKILKTIILPALLLFFICIVFSGALVLTNNVTEPIIAERAVQQQQAAMAQVMEQAHTFSDGQELRYNNSEYVYYTALDDAGKALGFVFITDAKGYGGTISVMTGVDTAGCVTGISLLEIDETPGLGMKAKDKSFLAQFVGKVKDITVSKQKPAENEVQAITGATITTTAVTDCVNLATQLFAQLQEQGGQSNG